MSSARGRIRKEWDPEMWDVLTSDNIQKMKIMASGPITSWEIDGETVETVRLYFSGFQNHYRW